MCIMWPGGSWGIKRRISAVSRLLSLQLECTFVISKAASEGRFHSRNHLPLILSQLCHILCSAMYPNLLSDHQTSAHFFFSRYLNVLVFHGQQAAILSYKPTINVTSSAIFNVLCSGHPVLHYVCVVSPCLLQLWPSKHVPNCCPHWFLSISHF